LYRLDADNADGLALRDVPLLPVPYPEAPITTMDALRRSSNAAASWSRRAAGWG
jgi:hypothetical protein